MQVSLDEHQRYCEKKGLDPQLTERQMIEKVRFGEYTGGVASRYFKQREFAEEYLNEFYEESATDLVVTHSHFGKQVGFTEQGTPLFEDTNGNFKTSIGESYNGQIFGLIKDHFVVKGSTFTEDSPLPTEEAFDGNNFCEQ